MGQNIFLIWIRISARKVEAFQDLTMEWQEQLMQRLSERPEGFVVNGQLISGCDYAPLNEGTLNQEK